MSDVVVRADALSKRYRIGARTARYRTLRETIMSAPLGGIASVRRLQRAHGDGDNDMVWALRDVSFELRRGEVLGIIGRNGAGKSTLLKVLSRVTQPTAGRAFVRGRVGSLLEVGTGFHPELTGRDNIYLNGSVLGMQKRAIDARLDDIIDFAGVAPFIDTPVKRYSTGMTLRLAFAVAAHLEPEVLLLDEVLAVGDAEFRRRCFGKMEEVAGAGRTVLFVSHDIGAVQSLCRRGLVLQDGAAHYYDTIDDAVSFYLRSLGDGSSVDLADRRDRAGRGQVRLRTVSVTAGPESEAHGVLATGRPARITFQLSAGVTGVACAFTIYDERGSPVAHLDSRNAGSHDSSRPRDAVWVCELDPLLLVPGRYRINTAVYHGNELEDHVEGAAFFDVESGSMDGRAAVATHGYGSVLLPHRWLTRPENS